MPGVEVLRIASDGRKPVVRYSDFMPVNMGERAWVCPLDHPRVHNRFMAKTGPVVAIHAYVAGKPVFETRNTVYVPESGFEVSDLPYPNNLQTVLT